MSLTETYSFSLRLSTIGVVFILLLLHTSCSFAQASQQHRYEREQKNGDEYYTVISLGAEGIALLRSKDKYNGNKKIWEVVLLDTALQERKHIEFEIDQRYPLIGHEIAPKHLYILYRTGETLKNSMYMVDINVQEGKDAARHDIKPELDFKITHFNKVGKNMVLGGYVSNEPAILLYDLENKSIKVVPGFFQKDSELIDLRINQNNTFNTVLIDRSLRSEQKFIFRTFDENGKQLLDDIVPVLEDRSLQTGISSTLEREDLIVLGTWGDKQGKQSVGFFSLAVDPFTDQKIRYFHFGELTHFLDYLNEKRATRIKANTKEDIAAGRKSAFACYVMPFKLTEHKDGFFLLAEIYYLVTPPNPYYSTPYGNPYYTNPYYTSSAFWPGYYPGMRMYRPYFSGNGRNDEEVKTYATVLVSFDSKGNLLWDQSVKLEEIKKTALEQVSDFYYTKSALTFIHKKESDLKVKTIDLTNDSFVESSEKIKLTNPTDEIRSEKEMEGGVARWVDNTFYVWGYQTIRNLSKKEDRTRDVFYINKVVVK